MRAQGHAAVQRRCNSVYLLTLLLVSLWHGQELQVAAQEVSSPSPAAAPATVSPSPTPSPGPAAGVGVPSPSPAVAESPSPSPTPLSTVTPPLQPPPSGPAGTPPASLPPVPATGGSNVGGSSSSGPTVTGSTGVPTPPGSTVPPVTGSTAGGVTTTPPTGTTLPVGGIPPTGGLGGSNITGNATNATMPGFVLPTPDDTAIDGLSPSDDDCKLMSALYDAMGAAGSSACTNSSTKASTTAGSSGSNSGMPTLSEYTRSSAAYSDGLFTASDGKSFCVSREGAAKIAQESGTRAQFASARDIRELPDIYDPACDDMYAASIHREGCPSGPRPASFMEDSSGNVVPSDDYNDDPGAAPAGAGVSPSPSPSPGPDLNLQDCSQKFTKVGSQPRSVAIVLLKWRREYYYSKDECCKQQNNVEGCDCLWGGRTYDNLLPLKAYTRMFADECDKGPSLNRAYYDLSGGKITFHSKLRVPVPSGYSLSPTPEPTVIVQNQPGGDGSSPAPDGSTTPVPDPPQPPPEPSPSPPPYTVPTDPVSTPTSYLDPNGIDVYGYATLDGMRNDNGDCRDWCGEAITQLGVKSNDYNHVVCLQLLGNSKALCDTCKDGACTGTCPADTGLTTGCGCATCYYAWGMQSGCTNPSAPGARTGLGYLPDYYQGQMAQLAGGEYVAIDVSYKMFLGHEIGHNMGLTHTGAISCKIADDGKTIMRDPQFCKPDWYGDHTSFMGSSPTLQIPSAIKYKVKWLPRGTLKLHTPGTERRWVLRPATVRRPSWQPGTSIRWFERRADTLAVRIPLKNPDAVATTSSYSCPCSPVGDDGNPNGICPACKDGAADNPCANGPCCLDPKCADKGLTWYYVELHMPFRNDYASTNRGLAIRMMGELASTSCTSTRAVPTHVKDGQQQYLLNEPDPTGEKPGSKFEDTLRGVKVVLEQWTNTSAVVYISA